VEEDFEDVCFFSMEMVVYGNTVVEMHVVALEYDSAIESGCGEGV
jgi:hypothetical protein